MNLNKELIIKIIILIILLLLVSFTSFRTGTKFYLLKNTTFDSKDENVNSEIARWNFEAKIILESEDSTNEKY